MPAVPAPRPSASPGGRYASPGRPPRPRRPRPRPRARAPRPCGPRHARCPRRRGTAEAAESSGGVAVRAFEDGCACVMMQVDDAAPAGWAPPSLESGGADALGAPPPRPPRLNGAPRARARWGPAGGGPGRAARSLMPVPQLRGAWASPNRRRSGATGAMTRRPAPTPTPRPIGSRSRWQSSRPPGCCARSAPSVHRARGRVLCVVRLTRTDRPAHAAAPGRRRRRRRAGPAVHVAAGPRAQAAGPPAAGAPV